MLSLSETLMVPKEIRGLAVLLMILGQGNFSELSELGYEIDSSTTERLASLCPNLEIDIRKGSFKTSESLPETLDASIVEALLATRKSRERQDMSDWERCFERMSALSEHLLSKNNPEQSVRLLKLTGQLLSVNKTRASLFGLADDNSGSLLFENVGYGEYENHEAYDRYGRIDRLAGSAGTAGSVGYVNSVGIRGPNTPANPVSPVGTANPANPARHIVHTFQGNDQGLDQITPLLRVRLFGNMEIEVGGEPILRSPLFRGKLKILFCLLVINQGKGMSREAAANNIWPDRDARTVMPSFYNLWSRLGSSLPGINGSSPYFEGDEGVVRINPRFVDSDISDFDRLSRLVLFEQGSLEERLAAIDRLEQLYRNDVLSGSVTHPRIQRIQQRYRDRLIDIMIKASSLHLEQGRSEMALWYAQKALDTDRSREDSYRVLMHTQETCGQRTQAMNTFHECRRFLSEELGISPSKQITALYQNLLFDGE